MKRGFQTPLTRQAERLGEWIRTLGPNEKRPGDAGPPLSRTLTGRT